MRTFFKTSHFKCLSAQVMTTNHCSLKMEENLYSAMLMRSVRILWRGRPWLWHVDSYCLQQPLPRAARDRAGSKCSAAPWNSTDTQLAGDPMHPTTHMAVHPASRAPASPSLMSTCLGPSLHSGVSHSGLSPANSSISTARDAELSLINFLLV